MIARWARDWEDGRDFVLGVFVGERVAGGCGLHRRGSPSTLEIGYWLHPSFTGQGLATGVARLLTDAAFALAGIEHVEIHSDKANTASAGVARRLRFEYLGETPDQAMAPGEVGIDRTWRIDRDAWRARNPTRVDTIGLPMTEESKGPASPGEPAPPAVSESLPPGVAAPSRVSGHLRELQQLTDVALTYLPLEALLQELLSRIADILAADTVAILLLDKESPSLVARAARGIEEEVERGVRIPLGKGFAGRIAAERRPITIDDVDHADILNPILREKGIRSLAGVPLVVEGRVLGVLHVGSLKTRLFTDDDVALLQLAADRAALAIEHTQLTQERQVAQTLQRSLLPARLPTVPGVIMAARYMPAAEVGGDWYDAFLGPGGKLVLVIGDVMGRGVPAAALMAQLRTAVRAYVFPGEIGGISLGEIGNRLNRLLLQLADGQMATLVCLVLDPETGELRMVNAGHLPPLLIGHDGQADYLSVDGGAPLGVSGAASYREQTVALPVGSTVLLYTDGLVEVRAEPVDEGLERLRGAIAGDPSDIERVLDRVVAAMAAEERPDDIALLALRILPLESELATRWPTHLDVLARVRALLRRWLRDQGATEEEVYELTVATQEACANAVEHAYGPGLAEFELNTRRVGDEVIIVVRDEGTWRSQRGTNRGRGMPLMRALTDAVDVTTGPVRAGTTVELRRRLGEGKRP